MKARRNPLVAKESLPFLLLTLVGFAVAVQVQYFFAAVAAAFLLLVLFLLFRDPHREIPPAPLAVVSPVDGRIVAVDRLEHGVLEGEAHHIRIEIDAFGAYAARAPVEGKIMDLHPLSPAHALWIQTDEGNDVVLQFQDFRLGLAPRSFIRIGERVGQGQRCAFLRLTRFADVFLPIAGKVLVKPGQIVNAGSDQLGKVPPP